LANVTLSSLAKGTYINTTAYTVGDIVDYNGSSYVNVSNGTGKVPTNTTYWAILASKGSTGATGPTGSQGIQGLTGATGTGIVGSVTAPLVMTGSTLSIPVATSLVNGYLSSANWTTFNSKESALGNPTTDGDILSSTILGVRSWIAPSTGGTPGGSTTQLQFNDAGVFGGKSTLTFEANVAGDLSIGDSNGNIGILRLYSGAVVGANADIQVDTAMTGGNGFTLPLVGDTLVGRASVDTLTNKTWNGVAIADTYIASSATWNAKENGLGNPTTNGYVLSSTTLGVRSWVASGTGGGITTATLPLVITGTDIELPNVTITSTDVSVGISADGSLNGTAVGNNVNGSSGGAAVGNNANGSTVGTAVGYTANGSTYGTAVGNNANGSTYGAAVGYLAYGFNNGTSVGYQAGRNLSTSYLLTNKNILLGYKAGFNLTQPSSWLASTAYTSGQFRRPIIANTFNYEVTTAGTTGTTEPTWDTTLGGTTTDGTVTWTTVSMRGNNNIILGYNLQGLANDADTLNIGNVITGDLVTGNINVSGNINIPTGSNFTINGVAIGGGVTSVNTQTGAVVLTTADISEVTNLYYTDTRVSANTDVSANTAKVGITTTQASAITANTAKVGITTTQASDITANNAKVGITTTQANDITANNLKVGVTTQISNVVEDTTPQLGGQLDAQANSIGFTRQTYTGVVGTTNIDLTKGQKYTFTFGAGNETLTFTAPAKDGTFLLNIIQDSVGGRTITWPTIVKWSGGGTIPTLTTTAGARDKVVLDWDSIVGQYDASIALNYK